MESEKIQVSLQRIDDLSKYTGEASGHPAVTLDTYPPFGTGGGYSPLELFLLSLSACTAMTTVNLLKNRMRAQVDDISIEAEGITRDEHPQGFTHIDIRLTIQSPDAREDAVQRAITAAEEELCPVWSMIKGNVDVKTTFTLKR